MDAPIRCLDTERIAPDTYLVRRLFGEGVNPVAVFLNSMVITGDEPIIVDTGVSMLRDEWTEDVFSLVEPADVRWIYLSHDDTDHTGNLRHFLDLCPNATLVTNWFSVERLAADYPLPLDRMRWVNDGERFTAGGRDLVAMLPPTFDSPTTRGLYDTATGVYWASDSFATPVTSEVTDVADLDPGFYGEAFLQMNRVLSPWHQWLDPAKYGAHLTRVAGLGASVVATAHGPALHGAQVGGALDLLARLPDLPAAPLPGQAELDGIVQAMLAATEPVITAAA